MDQETHLSSGSLFHYTPTLENLKGILRWGFRPSYSLERTAFSFVDDPSPEETKLFSQPNIGKWLRLRKNNPPDKDIYIAIVSFCDIPVRLSRTHVQVYGPYAIGLSKHWAEDVIGLNPILYMSSKSQLMRNFNLLWSRLSLLDSSYFFRPPPDRFSIRTPEEIKSEHAKDSLYQLRGYERILGICREISCHVKLYEGPFTHGCYHNPCHRFYDEREWRYLPPRAHREAPVCLDSGAPREVRDHFISKLAPLSIDFRFVTHLLVPSEEEKDELRSFLLGLRATGVAPSDLNSIQIMRFDDVCQQVTGGDA